MSLSPDEITDFLRTKYNNAELTADVVGEGAWSQAFVFELDSKRRVIRLSKESENFERDQLAGAYNRPGLPVPQILELGEFQGWNYAISEFAAGAYFEVLPANELVRVAPSVAQLLVALQRVDISHTTGYGHWDATGNGAHTTWQEYLLSVRDEPANSMIAGWKSNLENSGMGMTLFDAIYTVFERKVALCPADRHLIHSDLLNRNVLVTNGEISAVLDWGSSLYGDFLYDLAWFEFYAPWYPSFSVSELVPGLWQALQNSGANLENAQERVRCYQLHIGLDSVAYNAFRENWAGANEAAEYTKGLVG